MHFFKLCSILLVIDVAFANDSIISSSILYVGDIPSAARIGRLEELSLKKENFIRILYLKYGDDFFKNARHFLDSQSCNISDTKGFQTVVTNEGTNTSDCNEHTKFKTIYEKIHSYKNDSGKQQSLLSNETLQNHKYNTTKENIDVLCLSKTVKTLKNPTGLRKTYKDGTNLMARFKTNQALKDVYIKLKEIQKHNNISPKFNELSKYTSIYRLSNDSFIMALNVLDLCVEKYPDEYAALFIDVVKSKNKSTPYVRFSYRSNMMGAEEKTLIVSKCSGNCSIYDILNIHSHFDYMSLTQSNSILVDRFIIMSLVFAVVFVFIYYCTKYSLVEEKVAEPEIEMRPHFLFELGTNPLVQKQV